jgi:hypothetical protein
MQRNLAALRAAAESAWLEWLRTMRISRARMRAARRNRMASASGATGDDLEKKAALARNRALRRLIALTAGMNVDACQRHRRLAAAVCSRFEHEDASGARIARRLAEVDEALEGLRRELRPAAEMPPRAERRAAGEKQAARLSLVASAHLHALEAAGPDLVARLTWRGHHRAAEETLRLRHAWLDTMAWSARLGRCAAAGGAVIMRG